MRERLGDRETAPRSRQVGAEERERELVAGLRLGPSAATVSSSRTRMVLLQLARASGRILDRLAVAGQRDPRRELDRAVERREVVAERIGPARRPEPDRRRDPAEQMIGGDEHAVAEQAELTVGVTRCGDELPAVDVLAGLDEDRVALVADERPVDGALADELLGHVVGRAVELEPVDEPLRPVGVPPDELALRVVERALDDGRAGQLVEIGGRADVVGVEVRDEDGRDAPARLARARPPTSPSRRAGRRPVSTSVQPSSPGSRYAWTCPGRVGSGSVTRRIPSPSSSIARL